VDRKEILKVVIKHIKLNVGGLEDVIIDSSKSMAENGASSLDIVEIVSMIMRELQVGIKRTELADLKNINGLVDLLYKVVN